MRVKVQKPFSLVPILNAGTITIRGSSEMRIEQLQQPRTASTPVNYTAERPRVGGVLMSRRLVERTRGERGQVVVLAALMIPVFLLLGALVVDAGNWYAHKRSLQNRADAGALAAGLEYIENNNLRKLRLGARHDGHDAISNVAKAYAGTSDTSVGTTYNKNVNNQSNVTVAINATNPTARRLDGRRQPVLRPLRATRWSSRGGLWTDVKVREGNIGTLFGSFGISLPQIAAQARVEVEPIIGVALERPAVRRRDRRPDRVRLGAVRARARRRDDRVHA